MKPWTGVVIRDPSFRWAGLGPAPTCCARTVPPVAAQAQPNIRSGRIGPAAGAQVVEGLARGLLRLLHWFPLPQVRESARGLLGGVGIPQVTQRAGGLLAGVALPHVVHGARRALGGVRVSHAGKPLGESIHQRMKLTPDPPFELGHDYLLLIKIYRVLSLVHSGGPGPALRHGTRPSVTSGTLRKGHTAADRQVADTRIPRQPFRT